MKKKEKNEKSIKIHINRIDTCIFVFTIVLVINLITTLPYFTLYRYFESKSIEQSMAQSTLWKDSLVDVLTSDSIKDDTKREFANSLTSINEIKNSKTTVAIYTVGAYHILLSLAICATGVVMMIKKFKVKALAAGLIVSGFTGIIFTILTIFSAMEAFIF